MTEINSEIIVKQFQIRLNSFFLFSPYSQIAYALSWPTAGSAIILLTQPERGAMETQLRATGALDPAKVAEIRRHNQDSMQALKASAGKA